MCGVGMEGYLSNVCALLRPKVSSWLRVWLAHGDHTMRLLSSVAAKGRKVCCAVRASLLAVAGAANMNMQRARFGTRLGTRCAALTSEHAALPSRTSGTRVDVPPCARVTGLPFVAHLQSFGARDQKPPGVIADRAPLRARCDRGWECKQRSDPPPAETAAELCSSLCLTSYIHILPLISPPHRALSYLCDTARPTCGQCCVSIGHRENKACEPGLRGLSRSSS